MLQCKSSQYFDLNLIIPSMNEFKTNHSCLLLLLKGFLSHLYPYLYQSCSYSFIKPTNEKHPFKFPTIEIILTCLQFNPGPDA